MAWTLTGEYFESCSCDVLCPCIFSQATAMPTRGSCIAVLGFRVDGGALEGTELGGTTFAILLETPGPMSHANGRNEIYIGSGASGAQRAALERILSGALGGSPAGIHGLAPNFLGFKEAPIAFTVDGERRELRIDGVGEQSVIGLPGLGGEVLKLNGTGHPASNELALARAATATFKDDQFSVDNSGQNGHFAKFDWAA